MLDKQNINPRKCRSPRQSCSVSGLPRQNLPWGLRHCCSGAASTVSLQWRSSSDSSRAALASPPSTSRATDGKSGRTRRTSAPVTLQTQRTDTRRCQTHRHQHSGDTTPEDTRRHHGVSYGGARLVSLANLVLVLVSYFGSGVCCVWLCWWSVGCAV